MPSRFAKSLRTGFVWLCAVLALAISVLWVRSYWRCDEIGYYTHKPAQPGDGRDCRKLIGSNRGGLFWLETDADITSTIDWSGGEPTEIIRSSAPSARLALAAARAAGAAFEPVPEWHRGGFRLEAATAQLPTGRSSAPTASVPTGWYRAVVVPHWAVLLPLALPPLLRLRRRWIRHRWRKKGLCLNCGYDIRYSGEVCSECGQPTRQTQPVQSGRARKARLVAIGTVLVATAIVLLTAQRREKEVAVRLGEGTTLPTANPPLRIELDLGSGVAMRLALIPAGRFLMGSPETEAGGSGDEYQHEVIISRPFYMGITAVTQAQWRAVMGDSPSYFKGDRLPVHSVSWDDAVRFCEKLSQRSGHRLRLPTEAQWEYACRAGTTTPFNTGLTLPRDSGNYHVGWTYPANRTGWPEPKPLAVGSFRPNAWGLYDMHGNVWQWCSDCYGEYPKGEAKDPSGPANGTARVLRGGSWNVNPRDCRSAYRLRRVPGLRYGHFGFRLCLDFP